MITPWNWPLNQIACKVAPALAAGLHDGAQAVRGRAAERHHLRRDPATRPACRPACSTSSTATASTSARRCRRTPTSTWCRSPARPAPASRSPATRRPTVKRVAQELGGKSANIILDDADFASRDRPRHGRRCAPTRASRATRRPACSCPRPAWTRPRRSRPRRPRTSSSAIPARPSSNIGPVVSATQYGRIQQLIEKGIGEGAKLEVGGPGKPEGLETGYFVQADGVLARRRTT